MPDKTGQTTVVKLQVRVVPGAARTQVAGWLGKQLKLRVSAAPEKGKANTAVQALIAESLGLEKPAVQIVAGHRSQRKSLAISGLSESTILQKFGRPDGD